MTLHSNSFFHSLPYLHEISRNRVNRRFTWGDRESFGLLAQEVVRPCMPFRGCSAVPHPSGLRRRAETGGDGERGGSSCGAGSPVVLVLLLDLFRCCSHAAPVWVTSAAAGGGGGGCCGTGSVDPVGVVTGSSSQVGGALLCSLRTIRCRWLDMMTTPSKLGCRLSAASTHTGGTPGGIVSAKGY